MAHKKNNCAYWLGFMLIVLQGCQPKLDNTPIEFRVPVSFEKVSSATVESRIVTIGKLRSPEILTLTVQTAGLLQIAGGENGRLAEGDRVKVGQLIASITGEDARLVIKRAVVKQRLETAIKNMESTQILYDKSLISLTRYGSAKDALAETKLAYQISLNTEAQNAIRSPIDGIILKLSRNNGGQVMANGQKVENGQIIAQVASLESLIADIDLVSSDIPMVNKGMEAKITSHIWKNEQFTGQVIRLMPTIDDKTRTLRAEVVVNNAKGYLKPGMFIEVTLIKERKENVIVVPNRSIIERGGRTVVFVSNGQRVEQREVDLGIREGNTVEIINGIKLGEHVVVLGLETLSDQMLVQVSPTSII
jgi:membrane fusion protein (multidrug efflux system)